MLYFLVFRLMLQTRRGLTHLNASNEKRFNSSHIGGAFDFFTHAVFSDIEKSLNENGKFVGSAICEEHDIVKVEKFLVQNSNFTSFNILSLHDSLQFLLSRWHSVPRVFYQFFFKRKQPLLFLIYSCLRE